MKAVSESREDEQKRIEGIYLAEARRVSTIFPAAELHPFKPFPDFVTDDKSLGIEVTELCDPDGRSDGARLSFVVPRAKQMYNSRPDAPPLSVATGMSPQAEDMRVDELTQSLADFVYAHRHERGEIKDERLPRGWCHIAIFDPWGNQPADGDWPVSRAIHTVLGAKEMVEARITEKNARVSDYRAQVSEVWLLIVNNRYLGPGEVYLRADAISTERFTFAFDRVLVFLRDIGAGGEVVELQRAS